ncbi:hypothetical protein GOV10_02945 [Candidatus Woesearchaeota archaeon]|nr:hypothetical protein [Candidatus Woesearchaeota archaeon]
MPKRQIADIKEYSLLFGLILHYGEEKEPLTIQKLTEKYETIQEEKRKDMGRKKTQVKYAYQNMIHMLRRMKNSY